VRIPSSEKPPADTAAPASTQPPAPVAPQATDPLVERVVQWLKAKRPEAQILRVVQNERRVHNLSAADRARLEDAGASENLIDAIMHKASEANASESAVAPAAAQPSDRLVEHVLQLLKARRPEANIMRVVQANGRPHDLSAAERAQLEQAGASENLIEAIMHPKLPGGAPNALEAPAHARGDEQQAKAQACQQEAKIAFPNDAVAQAKALLTCMGVK
jgi:hypothetical protein